MSKLSSHNFVSSKADLSISITRGAQGWQSRGAQKQLRHGAHQPGLSATLQVIGAVSDLRRSGTLTRFIGLR